MKEKRQDYGCPMAEVIDVSAEDVICGSPLRFYETSGSSGDDIEEDDIINGGSF